MSRISDAFSPFPELSTPRLHLRPCGGNNIAPMYALACNPRVTEWLQWEPHASADVTAAFVRRLGAEYARGECMTWAVCERRRDRFMGMISFIAVCAKCRSGEIGYWLGEPYWNRGYMTEALRMVVGFGFDRMRLHRVWAAYIVGNPASGRVMQKAGMRFEGIGRGEILHQGLFCDLAHYAIVKE